MGKEMRIDYMISVLIDVDDPIDYVKKQIEVRNEIQQNLINMRLKYSIADQELLYPILDRVRAELDKENKMK